MRAARALGGSLEASVGSFFLRKGNDKTKALTHYLNTYFLDPHYYDWEYAGDRIRTLNLELATERFRQLREGGMPIARVVLDRNPAVAHLAIAEMTGQWQASHVGPLLQVLGHDDPAVRFHATLALVDHVDERFDETLRSLLEHQDLRVRGLAGYIAVRRWKDKGVARVAAFLEHEADLLRFDAVSALLVDGGERGRALVRAHTAREKDTWLVEMLREIVVQTD